MNNNETNEEKMRATEFTLQTFTGTEIDTFKTREEATEIMIEMKKINSEDLRVVATYINN